MIGGVMRQARWEARHRWLRARRPRTYVYRGVRVPLRATEDLARASSLLFRNWYEGPELDALAQVVRAQDTVLEVGGGCGIVSAFTALRLSDSRRMHTVEANPRLIASIRAVAAANGLHTDIRWGVAAAEDGEAEFFVDEAFLSSSAVDRGRGAERKRVPALGMSNLLAELAPNLLIVDVEGAETDVLATALPASVRAIVVELHPHVIGIGAVSNVVRGLLGQGFDFDIDRSRERTVVLSRSEH